MMAPRSAGRREVRERTNGAPMTELLYEKHDVYAIFTLNRPERLNALGGGLMGQLDEAIEDFNADPKMRAGILTGSGRAFCAGMDLKEAADRAASGDNVTGTRPDGRVYQMAFSRSPKPFIAAINGLAIGGGCEIALDCDIRIMSSEAYIGLFEPKRGIMAGYAMHHLPRIVGSTAAAYMLLTADGIESGQALEWGVVSEVVEPERLIPRAAEIAGMIAGNAPLSVHGTKAEIQAWRMASIDDNYRLYQWIDAVVLDSEDAREGPQAFAEKRDPVWQGR